MRRHTNNGIAARSLVGAALACAVCTAGFTLGAGVASAAPAPTFSVASFGAVGDGHTDATAAFAAAIAAAQAQGGGTVTVPAGTYLFSQPSKSSYGSSIQIHGTAPVQLIGAGASSTSLVEGVAGQSLLSVRADGSSVQGLTADTQTDNGLVAISVTANNTLLSNDRILGGSQQFALYYPGPAGATPTNPSYDTGNVVQGLSINDRYQGDGFSFSFQENGSISNVTHFGSRLSLYVDNGVTVNNYQYTPNPLCGGATNGFYITAPSTNVTIDNFVSSGEGGIISNKVDNRSSSNITIGGEQLTSAGGDHLEVGDVSGLTVANSNFGNGNSLLINPPVSATGVVVENSIVPAVRLSEPVGATVSADFASDTFPALVTPDRVKTTFFDWHQAPASVKITRGSWANQTGGFSLGGGVTYSMSGLRGMS
jgi:hypothetical protein